MSNKAGLTALHLACQAGDTLLVCICQEEANSKESSSFPDKVTSSTKNLVKVIFRTSMRCFTYHVSWMDGLARTKRVIDLLYIVVNIGKGTLTQIFLTLFLL